MAEVDTSGTFDRWLRHLRDVRGRAVILARIERLAIGNAGDVKPIGGGLE
jgi:putative addiction module killer protein